MGMQSGSRLIVMTKCIRTSEAHHQQITTRFRTLARGDCSKHPVSYDYELVPLPHPFRPR